ncbi:MAG: hypothetical protein IJ744_01160 [Lachnospiraceae bacterium]|nr:hypothetical protein [Lachnospiraceae bacterium]
MQVFFQACANLYGIAPVAHLWDVYKEYAKKQKCPKIRKKDLVVFAGIVRREVHNYEVYRYDEIYPDEVDSDLIVVLGRHCQLWAEEVVFL